MESKIRYANPVQAKLALKLMREGKYSEVINFKQTGSTVHATFKKKVLDVAGKRR